MTARGWRGLGIGACGVALVLAGLAAWAAGIGRREVAGPVAFEEVARGRFLREVTATGVLKAVDATPVTVPHDVQMPMKAAWIEKDGTPVQKGDPVVTFDPTDMERQRTEGEADRTIADLRIGKTRTDAARESRSLTLDAATAREAASNAEAFAPKDRDIFSRRAIIESEIDRDLYRKRSDAATERLATSAKLREADLALGGIERGKAEIRIRQAEKSLGSLRVLAPHDGLFVLERSWRGETIGPGEMLWPGQKIGEIPDLSRLEARVYVLEADAAGLLPGKTARIAIDGRPGLEYRGTVARVEAVAKERDWRLPTKYFEAVLALETTDPAVMKPGQNARARIVLEETENAIAVPRGAVFEKDGKRIVYRLEGRRFVPVEVTVGSFGLGRVVIEKGLAPGDRIALRDPSRSAAEIFGSAGKPEGSSAPGEKKP